MTPSPELQAILDAIPSRKLLRPAEVAEIFSVTKRTIYTWYEMGKISGINVGGTIRIYRQSVIDTLMTGAEAAPVAENDASILRPFFPPRPPRSRGWVRGWR